MPENAKKSVLLKMAWIIHKGSVQFGEVNYLFAKYGIKYRHDDFKCEALVRLTWNSYIGRVVVVRHYTHEPDYDFAKLKEDHILKGIKIGD